MTFGTTLVNTYYLKCLIVCNNFLHACNFLISSFMLLRNRLFQRPNYLTPLVFTYLLFSCGIRPSLLVLCYCHFTLYSYFTHAYFFSFTSKSPCISVHYSTLWIMFWRQYVTGRPPGLLPCARSLVWYWYTHASCLTGAPPPTWAMEHNGTIRIIWSLFRTLIVTSRALWHRHRRVLVSSVIKVSYRSH